MGSRRRVVCGRAKACVCDVRCNRSGEWVGHVMCRKQESTRRCQGGTRRGSGMQPKRLPPAPRLQAAGQSPPPHTTHTHARALWAPSFHPPLAALVALRPALKVLVVGGGDLGAADRAGHALAAPQVDPEPARAAGLPPAVCLGGGCGGRRGPCGGGLLRKARPRPALRPPAFVERLRHLYRGSAAQSPLHGPAPAVAARHMRGHLGPYTPPFTIELASPSTQTPAIPAPPGARQPPNPCPIPPGPVHLSPALPAMP